VVKTYTAATANRSDSGDIYDKQKQVLGEYFEGDSSRIEPVSVEPRHQAEGLAAEGV
jgi:hypothetical protein